MFWLLPANGPTRSLLSSSTSGIDSIKSQPRNPLCLSAFIPDWSHLPLSVSLQFSFQFNCSLPYPSFVYQHSRPSCCACVMFPRLALQALPLCRISRGPWYRLNERWRKFGWPWAWKDPGLRRVSLLHRISGTLVVWV